jgi:hypothetical protein
MVWRRTQALHSKVYYSTAHCVFQAVAAVVWWIYLCVMSACAACRFGGVYSMMYHDHGIGIDPCRAYQPNNMLVTCYKLLLCLQW